LFTGAPPGDPIQFGIKRKTFVSEYLTLASRCDEPSFMNTEKEKGRL